jgi:hypothetical protein
VHGKVRGRIVAIQQPPATIAWSEYIHSEHGKDGSESSLCLLHPRNDVTAISAISRNAAEYFLPLCHMLYIRDGVE